MSSLGVYVFAEAVSVLAVFPTFTQAPFASIPKPAAHWEDEEHPSPINDDKMVRLVFIETSINDHGSMVHSPLLSSICCEASLSM